MTSRYPAQIDSIYTLPPVTDNSTPISSSFVNQLREAVINVEKELGIKPSGIYGTLRDRLIAIDNAILSLANTGGSVAFGGDLVSASSTTQTVTGIQGRAVQDVTPNDGYALGWSASNNRWEPIEMTAALSGQSAGGDLSGTYPNPTVAKIQGRGVYNIAPDDGYVLTWSSSNNRWEPAISSGGGAGGTAGGDLSGTYPNPTVAKIQGRDIYNTAPSNGNALVWSTSNNRWEPSTVVGSSLPEGWVSIVDYGAIPSDIGTNANDCTQAFLDAIAAVTTNFNTTTNHGVVYVPPSGVGKEWYIAGIANDSYDMPHLEVSRCVAIRGVGTGRSQVSGSRIKLGPYFGGFRTISQQQSSDNGNGSGTLIEGLDFFCTPIEDTSIVDGWQSNHAYSVGDKIRPTRFHCFYYECIKAGTSNGPTPSIGDCSRYATTATPGVGNRWQPGKTYAVNDKIYPNNACGKIFKCTVGGTTIGETYPSGEPVAEYVVDAGQQINAGEPNWYTSEDDPRATVRSSIAEWPSGPTWIPDEDDPEPIWEYDNPGTLFVAKPYQTNHTYHYGAQVLATGRYDVLFEANTGGLHTTAVSAGSEPVGFATAVLDDTIVDGSITWKCIPAIGLVSDGSVVWAARFAGAIMVNDTFNEIKRCSISSSPTAAIAILSWFTATAPVFADFTIVDTAMLYQNAVGIYAKGLDSNACTISKVFLVGKYDYWADPAEHAFYDQSFLGNHYDRCVIQGCSGYGFGMMSPAGSGSISSCYVEGVGRKSPLRGSVAVKGGTFASSYFRLNQVDTNTAKDNNSSGSIFLDQMTGVKSFSHSDLQAGMKVWAALKSDRSSSFHFYAENEISPNTNDDPSGYQIQYGGIANWWALQHSNSYAYSAFLLSGEHASIGRGHLWFRVGYQTGATNPHYRFGDDSASRSSFAYSSVRNLGDVVERAGEVGLGKYYYKINLDSSGGKYGFDWSANTAYGVGTIVVPTYGNETTNHRAFQCTTGGTSGGTEPTWTDTLSGTVNDNGVVWTAIDGANFKFAGLIEDGNTSLEIQSTSKWADSADTNPNSVAPKAQTRSRRRQIQTTTATANQVIEDGGVFGTEDFVLPTSSMTVIKFTILVKKSSTADGGSIEVQATYVRDGAGAPTLIGAADITYNLSGTTLDATTVDLNVNGNRVELRTSPESADTLNWRIFRTQFEGTD